MGIKEVLKPKIVTIILTIVIFCAIYLMVFLPGSACLGSLRVCPDKTGKMVDSTTIYVLWDTCGKQLCLSPTQAWIYKKIFNWPVQLTILFIVIYLLVSIFYYLYKKGGQMRAERLNIKS